MAVQFQLRRLRSPDRGGERRQNVGAQLAAITILALLPANASAADFPNLVGVWKVPDRERSATPYQQADDAALTVKIVRQDGDSFAGTVISLKGRTERIAGAFRRDARTFIFTSQRTAGMGKVQGNKMEICRTDAPCTALVRSK
jgi:hypothetical protein